MFQSKRAPPPKRNGMSLADWLDLESARAVLDVGCNVGGLLQGLAQSKPNLHLAGVEVNREALEKAREVLPSAALHVCGAEAMPFEDGAFDCVTCIEVLEHIPATLRRPALQEIFRVLKPGGQLLLQVPHAGAFAWLDPGNARFRFPKLYSRVLRSGLRDNGMQERTEGVLWHHHFGMDELETLTTGLFTTERVHHGGLFLFPLSDLARWPFYKLKVYDGSLFHGLGKLAEWDFNRDYGRLSYDVRLLLKKGTQ
jgi:SAM-dependent methyltransferase